MGELRTSGSLASGGGAPGGGPSRARQASGVQAVGRVKPPLQAEHVLEVVTPRTNAARLSPAENLFGALVHQADAATGAPVSLEIAADAERRRFLVRTATLAQQQIGRAHV